MFLPQHVSHVELDFSAGVKEVGEDGSVLVHHSGVVEEVSEGGEVGLLVEWVTYEGVCVGPDKEQAHHHHPQHAGHQEHEENRPRVERSVRLQRVYGVCVGGCRGVWMRWDGIR